MTRGLLDPENRPNPHVTATGTLAGRRSDEARPGRMLVSVPFGTGLQRVTELGVVPSTLHSTELVLDRFRAPSSERNPMFVCIGFSSSSISPRSIAASTCWTPSTTVFSGVKQCLADLGEAGLED